MSGVKGMKRCEPQDIVGKIYNGRQVLSYEGIKVSYHGELSNFRRTYMYKTRCTTCGEEKVLSRASIINNACKKCNPNVGRAGVERTKELIEKTVKSRSINSSPNRNNYNGIKYVHSYYSVRLGYRVYQARAVFGGKVRRCYSGKDVDIAIFWAKRMQDKIAEKGINGFIEWFDSGEWKEEKAKNN